MASLVICPDQMSMCRRDRMLLFFLFISIVTPSTEGYSEARSLVQRGKVLGFCVTLTLEEGGTLNQIDTSQRCYPLGVFSSQLSLQVMVGLLEGSHALQQTAK